jgi:riboflavin kinase/FMN adenylyltransferase
VKVARSPEELEQKPRAVALGTFDGVHRGHRAVLEAALAAGPTPTVVTLDPHPRIVFGNRVELITTLERRLELLAELGIEETLVVRFDLERARAEPEEFVEAVLEPIGAEVLVAGDNFRFGRGRRGNPELLRRRGFDMRVVATVEGVSSTAIRRLVSEGQVEAAAQLLGRPHEVDGIVVAGDARGGTLGYPTANLSVDPQLLVPAYGIYAGAGAGHRAAISIGTNPHYGGEERRIESFLLGFEGDLYGRRLRLEVWKRLREERVFESEAALIEQIGRDVEEAQRAHRPV